MRDGTVGRIQMRFRGGRARMGRSSHEQEPGWQGQWWEDLGVRIGRARRTLPCSVGIVVETCPGASSPALRWSEPERLVVAVGQDLLRRSHCINVSEFLNIEQLPIIPLLQLLLFPLYPVLPLDPVDSNVASLPDDIHLLRIIPQLL